MGREKQIAYHNAVKTLAEYIASEDNLTLTPVGKAWEIVRTHPQ